MRVVSILAVLVACCLVVDTAEAQRRTSSSAKATKPASNIPHGPAGRPPRVEPVDEDALGEVRRSAQKIDALIEANYAKHSISPSNELSDPLFCRRAYLSIAGRIPTSEELMSFITSNKTNPREILIDELLSSYGYASHNFNYWANILRLQDHPVNNNQIAQPYHEWIKQCLRDNKPYDKWVYEMLTAEGQIWENPATGYLMRDSGMELDASDNTIRIFLGTQIGCAQCHDHPFDRWTQHEFFRMAAFTFGTRTRAFGGDKSRFTSNPLARLRAELKAMDPEANGNGTFARLVNANLFEVYDQARALRLPHDYQYDDAKPKDVVTPRPIFGGDLEIKKGENPRVVFAKWLTSPENPRFAKTIANRLWKKAFGVGLIEPVDDIRDESVASNPELMDFLIAEMIRLKFNLKEFERIIYNTKAWQRQAIADDVNPAEPFHFPGPILQRMTAEQIWDSLMTLAVYNLDNFQRTSFADLPATIDLDLNAITASELQAKAKEFDEKFGSGALRKEERTHSYKGMTIARASELPAPLPANHFLRQFGQGDRELIEAATTDGSVSQILTMFNGWVTHMMLDKGSVLVDNVNRGRNAGERIDIIFLTILNRRPDRNEKRLAEAEFKQLGDAGVGNVVWALINTKEFLFIQ